MRTRAERRHHHQRMINKVKEFEWLKPTSYWGSENNRQKTIKKIAENRKFCSCWMCSNQREHWGDTIQEKKLKQFYESDGGDHYDI